MGCWLDQEVNERGAAAPFSFQDLVGYLKGTVGIFSHGWRYWQASSHWESGVARGSYEVAVATAENLLLGSSLRA